MADFLRSFLFVPANSERKISKAHDSGTDAIILDLEDSVMPADKAEARTICVDTLQTKQAENGPQYWVRVNPLDSGLLEADLAAIIPARPAGIMLPKPDGPVDVETVSRKIAELEQSCDLPIGAIQILPIATETARAVSSLSLYPRIHLPRLWGMTWGAEDLAADLGASTNRDENGDFFFVHQMSRAHTLLAAKASNVFAIESIYTDFRDADGLAKFARRAFVEGFNGMMAIHPNQIETINQSFMPNPKQIDHAHAVIKAFADNPGAGAVNVDGKMTDIPHLKQAQNVLTLAKKFGEV